jgi:hypothetical protein
MGRRAKGADARVNKKRVLVRLTEDEFEMIHARAAGFRLSMSRYLARAGSREIECEEEVEDVEAQPEEVDASDQPPTARLFYGQHVLLALSGLLPASISCVVTSPTYWACQTPTPGPAVRWYDGRVVRLGSEDSWEEYVEHLCSVFEALRGSLTSEATVWVILRDTLRAESYLGVPWRFATKMMENGWLLRAHAVWAHSNVGPIQTSRRLRQVHEDVFFFTPGKQPYYFRGPRGDGLDGEDLAPVLSAPSSMSSVWNIPHREKPLPSVPTWVRHRPPREILSRA